MRLNSDSLHDLSGPVNQIGAMAELVRKRYGSKFDEEAVTLFGFIQESAGRLQNLMAGLRAHMRVLASEGIPCLCDVNTLLAAAKVSLQPEIDQTDAAVTSDHLPELYCEPRQIEYTLTCLIENAIKFRRETQPEIHVSASLESDAWLFKVSDNGIGIDPRYHARIFGMFKRIDPDTYVGSGAGLAIARQIGEQHGGRIWVESEPGRGATFFFTLPQLP